MSSNPYGAAYLESQILSASPLKLVYMAYEGALDAVREARVSVREKKIFERSSAITKAQLILRELARTLDFEKGGDLSVRLAGLYDYMLRRLNDANFHQVEEPLAEVQGLLETMAEAWRELSLTENAVMTPSGGASSWMNAPDASAYSRTEFTF